ncbi:DEAD/DEAH box helicase family protein [Helicobacter trogontum]|uniref:restriction endonuclease n=1 Tax=Helicobacter trogontum TaxID=50960 RepID=UPI002A91F3F8|nr:DEAD/DEAH box helicase family protein [Helicobacter trogontum]MDY5184586.1 DEAD/DEAH box helicase family protein [Helicobacter trogontum]
MIFEKQDYQQNCLGNIIKILQDFDFKKQENLKECLETFYKTAPLPIQNISNKLNLDILMETGTGKTFTYLNLIFELNKRFKQNKFIIFVPRKAILESVKQNITLTKDYFYSEYNKHLKAYTYTDSKSQSLIINHYIKNEDELSVLILTNSAIDKKDNILNKNNENLFNTQSIFENIAALKPISIIDEPHLLKGEAFNKYFSKLNSLYFRFGATFPKEAEYELSNVAYCLDSICAFRSYLVKQICVHTLIQDNTTPFLISTNTNKPKSATFSFFKDGIEKRTTILQNNNLGELDSSFRTISLENITKDKAYLNNGEVIERKKSYKLSPEEITSLLARAIDLHFKKEEYLFQQNIKALSLFFIPEIKDFRGENPFIKNEFERLYKLKREAILKQNISESYKEYLQKDFDDEGILKVHQGYFSGDSNLINKKKENNKENLEADDIKLILQEKEKLLSFDTSLRFIFSVWALQEGWDNPNIFTLTKLANSSSDTSRHQQVGRGLRICVNNEGKRITHRFLRGNENEFFDINRLDMLVSSEERGFIEGLQKEIMDSSFALDAIYISQERLEHIGLNAREAGRFLITLEDLNLVEFDENSNIYKIIAPIYEAIKENENLKRLLADKFECVLESFKAINTTKEQVQNANAPKERVKIKQDLAKEFKELWHTINQKSVLVYENINQEALIQSIAKSFNQNTIPRESIVFESKVFDSQNNKIITTNLQEINTKDYTKALEKDFRSLALDFARENQIPLPFLLKLLNNLDRQHFNNSPKKAFESLKNIFKEELHKNLLMSVGYEFTQSYSNESVLYNENGKPREDIEAQKLGKFIAKDSTSNEPLTPASNYLFEKVVYDSQIEKEVILEETKEIDSKSIVVFAKLPKFSIPTPFKNYEPDFAYLLKDKNGQKIFFVCETKGYNDTSQIPEVEQKKIDYAKRFFKSLQESLKDENIKVVYNTRINKQDLLASLKQAQGESK